MILYNFYETETHYFIIKQYVSFVLYAANRLLYVGLESTLVKPDEVPTIMPDSYTHDM